MNVKQWSVTVYLTERDRRTTAEALLKSEGDTRLQAVGHTDRDPGHVDVPAIGDEIAAGRALSALAHMLLSHAADGLAGATRASAHPHA